MRLGWAVLAAAGPARHHKTIELAGAGWWWLVVLAAGPTSGPPPPGRDRPAQPSQPAAATSQISMQQPSSSPAILTSTTDQWWATLISEGVVTRHGVTRAPDLAITGPRCRGGGGSRHNHFLMNQTGVLWRMTGTSPAPAGQSTRQQAQAAQAHRHRHSRMVRWLLCRTWQPGHCSWTCSPAAAALQPAAAITLHWSLAYDDMMIVTGVQPTSSQSQGIQHAGLSHMMRVTRNTTADAGVGSDGCTAGVWLVVTPGAGAAVAGPGTSN